MLELVVIWCSAISVFRETNKGNHVYTVSSASAGHTEGSRPVSDELRLEQI